MPDLSELEALIARLAAIDFSQTSEQATREMAVNPVIDALGWDTFNPAEVAREYPVRGGKVDYCLRGPRGVRVLIEVKRTGTELGGHQEQLLRYAFEEGVPLAALTDGLVWWLYLPTAGGSWEQRRFARLGFGEEDAAHAASALHRFLSREGLVRGTALDAARRAFESQERERRVRGALQDAWELMIGDPQGLLRDLLAETVEELSGYRPDQGTVTEFLQGVSGTGSTRIPPRPDPDPQPAPDVDAPNGDSRRPVHTSEEESYSGHRPVAFWLDDSRYEATRWTEAVRGLCDQLAKVAGSDFDEQVVPLKSRSGRLYFSEEPDRLLRPMRLHHSRLYVSGFSDANNSVRVARRVLIAVRGSDDGFRVELAGQESSSNDSTPEQAEFDPAHKLLIVKIRRTTVEENEGDIFRAVRGSWRLNPRRAERAHHVLAVVEGVCKAMFDVHEWRHASDEAHEPPRYEFDGEPTDPEVSARYLGKLIPPQYRKPGIASPVLYVGC